MSEFQRVSPESAGIDPAAVEQFLREEKEAGNEVHSFMIIRDGKVAAEGWADPYRKDLRHPMFSFSKTLTAAAAGFAVQEGILSVGEKLVDLFPEYCPPVVSDNLAQADVRSLLTMSCGHQTEMTMAEVDRCGGNWIRAFLSHPFRFAPHTVFQYNTWGTDLIAAVLQKKTGQNLIEYLTPRLFQPLGITDAVCARRGTGDAFTSSVQGGGWGMKLTTDDMGKVIWFLQQGGVWEGKRLLDSGWIQEMTSRQIETDNPYYNNGDICPNWLQGYGYQNWQCSRPGCWRADGAFGQFGISIPDKHAAVILTSCALNTEAELNIVFDTLVSAMKDAPVPENPEAERSLSAYLSGWKVPVLWGIRAPVIEKHLSGIRFEADADGNPSLEDFIGGTGYFEKDDLSVKAVTFRFSGNTAYLDFELNRRPEQTAAPAPFDPFSPAGRTIPAGNEHLICREDDPADAVTQTLAVGMDGAYRLSRLPHHTIAASGTFVSPSVFEMNVRNTETVEAVRVRATFFRGMLNLEAVGSIPEESRLTMRAYDGMHFHSES